MKAPIIRIAITISLLMIVICCSDKKDDNEQKDIISWIKPCQFKNGNPSLNSMSVKSDQGFLVSGFFSDDDEIHGVVINMNSSGDTLWTKTITLEDFPESVVFYVAEKSPDEIILTGLTDYYNGHRFIMWLDGTGNKTREVVLPEFPGYTIWNGELFLNSNGNIGLASFMSRINDVTNTSSALRIDLYSSEGLALDSTLYSNAFTSPDRIIQNSDGDLLITGATWPGGSLDNNQMLFIRTNPSGELITRKDFGSDSWDVGESVCTDFSGGYFVSGSLTYSCEPVIYPVNSSGETGQFTSVADTIHSYGAMLKKANDGYLMFLQGYSRLYFIRMDKGLKVKYISSIDHHNTPVTFAPMFMHIHLMKDGSFAFLYISDLYEFSVIKTKPV
jgi:hypothetical protein